MPADQFHVAHCSASDSLLNHPGYSVRASSSLDRGLLEAACRFPPYELPIEMWKRSPKAVQAPRRLARVEFEGRVWVAHSAYVEKDTVGRDRSYFSHLLLPSSAPALDVLRSWGTGAWVTRALPEGQRVLPRLMGTAAGALVGDASLTAFLNDDGTGPTELSLAVCPKRLSTKAEKRRVLFARFLVAMMLRSPEVFSFQSPRRLYVHAEPGLVALMLYGAVRLLPPQVTDRLTFSTFEPYHRNIRAYDLADVVGTYTGSPDVGLNEELGGTGGLVFDTFDNERSSPELHEKVQSAMPAGVRELLSLAVAGEWSHLPAVLSAVGTDRSGLGRVRPVLTELRRKATGMQQFLAPGRNNSPTVPAPVRPVPKAVPRAPAPKVTTACPRCKRAVQGAAGARFCVVCDLTF